MTKLPDELKEKFRGRLRQPHGARVSDMAALAGEILDKFPIRDKKTELYNELQEERIRLTKLHGTHYFSDWSNLKKFEAWKLKKESEFYSLREAVEVERREIIKKWCPVIEKFLIEEYGTPVKDSLGVVIAYGGRDNNGLYLTYRYKYALHGVSGDQPYAATKISSAVGA